MIIIIPLQKKKKKSKKNQNFKGICSFLGFLKFSKNFIFTRLKYKTLNEMNC